MIVRNNDASSKSMQAMAEAYFGWDQADEEEEMLKKAKEVSPGEFSLDSYYTRRSKLDNYISIFKSRYLQ